MVSNGPLLPTWLNHEGSIFQKSQTFQSVPHASTTFSYLQPHFMSAKQKRVRNQSLESIHTSEQRPSTVTAFSLLSIKTDRNVLMFLEKQTTLSTKTKANSWKYLLHSSMSNADGPNVWKVIRPMTPSPRRATQSTMTSPRLTFASTIVPGSASSTWQKRTVISTVFPKNAQHSIYRQWKLHLHKYV